MLNAVFKLNAAGQQLQCVFTGVIIDREANI